MAAITTRLLTWYDAHARDLPWRMRHGQQSDPYRVWLSEIMLQQTVVKAVIPYFENFIKNFPTIHDLAKADRDEVLRLWAGLGYYSRARNLHACAMRLVADHGGLFPDTIAELKKLPGIGTYTAGAIAAIAFGQRVPAIDGNVERVISRLYAIDQPLPAAKALITAKTVKLVPADRPGDFAQALMDLGATICIPKAPRCDDCPLSTLCKAKKSATQTHFPIKGVKKVKPHREGIAFILYRRDGAVLLENRPDQGLLGGMTGVPTSEWREKSFAEQAIKREAPCKAAWKKIDGTVTHVFTHFTLTLTLYHAKAPDSFIVKAPYRWSSANGPEGEALPTLFRKVIAAARKIEDFGAKKV